MSQSALVAFYSRKGHVARVAEGIATATGADTERIIDQKFRGWPWSYIAANREAVNSVPANIVEPRKDPAGYDLVIAGSPVWKDRLSTPVLAYLRRFSGRLPEVAFFVTYLTQGEHLIQYRMRAEIPGTFHALPTLGWAMYAPELRANSDEKVLKVVD